MVTKYLRAAMRGAKYELLEEGGYYGSIPGFDGVWADAACLEGCRDELEEVVQEWLLFRLSRQLPVPVVEGIDLVVREVACPAVIERSGRSCRPF
jgi:predicted RNase H-like HicB family nuclease